MRKLWAFDPVNLFSLQAIQHTTKRGRSGEGGERVLVLGMRVWGGGGGGEGVYVWERENESKLNALNKEGMGWGPG